MKLDFKGKKVTVMGIGLHGGSIDMIKWLLFQGAMVIATDKKTKEDLGPSIEKLSGLKNLKLVLNQHRMEDFENADLVIKNPAVRWNDKYIQSALRKKVPVEMDSSLFFKLCPTKNIIGVTGTKGKSTTSLLISKILEKAGKKTVKVGIGQDLVISKLAEIEKDTWVVFELSSWRLSALGRIGRSPKIAVVTNIYQDHLNYYSDMQQYIQDKENIYKNQKSSDFLVLNRDNQRFGKYQMPEGEAKSQRIYFSMEKIEENKAVYIEQGKIKYNFDGQLGDICNVNGILLRGAHNISNALAACAVGIALKIKPEDMKNVLENFKGLPHRMETVKKIGNVDFINDTAATTPESAVAAIDSFSGSIFLIAGGSNKNLDMEPLIEKIIDDKNIKHVFLLEGEASRELKAGLEKTGAVEKMRGMFDNIEKAVEAAFNSAKEEVGEKNKYVLLSPGCASFGMFKNEFDRGDKFVNAVNSL